MVRLTRLCADQRGQEGFTLVEIMTAVVILAVALLGVGTAVMIQSSGIAASITSGQAAVSRGYYVSTGIMLAQERLEEMKRVQWKVGQADPFGSSATSAPTGFPDESSISGYTGFSRKVRIVDLVTNLKTVTVTATFTLPKETGSAQESVVLSTLIAARP